MVIGFAIGSRQLGRFCPHLAIIRKHIRRASIIVIPWSTHYHSAIIHRYRMPEIVTSLAIGSRQRGRFYPRLAIIREHIRRASSFVISISTHDNGATIHKQRMSEVITKITITISGNQLGRFSPHLTILRKHIRRPSIILIPKSTYNNGTL